MTVVLAVLGICCGAAAQVTTTTIQDTVYRADGTPASGTVLVSWPTFTTAAGQAVAAGNTSAAIGPNGALSLTLTPNANATPTGTYYTAVLHLDDGTTSQQYWVVPVSATAVTLAAIENQVLPSSVAMQTASRAYVDAKIAAVSGTGTTGSYVPTTGGTMTGPLVLPADPVTPNQASDKHYVDTNITAVLAGVGQKVSLVPTVTQTVAQPAGTQLGVNALNGELFASGFQTGPGGNGIASALSSTGCGSGCTVVAEPNYSSGEPVVVPQIPNGGHVVDMRYGSQVETFVNPLGRGSVGKSLSQYASAPLNSGAGGFTLNLSNTALVGGTNQLPGGIEAAPYGKSTYGVSVQTGNYYTEGQHINDEHTINCYAVGDCLQGSYTLTHSGGYRDWADEGAHPFDLDVTEDVRVFQGTCSTGCTTGSTSLFVNATANGGTQGEGRFLIDKNPSKTISTGQIISNGGDTMAAIVSFSGTNFPPSVFLETAGTANSQATNIAPGTVTLPIATSGVPSGYAINTSQLPATGVACVMDTNTGGRFPNFEMASYTVVDATHLTMTLNKAHAPGALLGVGGMCGYGIEQTADTVGSIRQIFPIVGTVAPNELYYASSGAPILGDSAYPSTSGFANMSAQVSSISRHGNLVTATLTQNLPADVTGLTMTMSGVADATYNGSFVVTSAASNQVTYADTGADGTSSGGTISYLNGGYVLYPMAEVLSVYNPNTKQVDGQLTLGANTVQWAPGDAVEEPHFYMMLTSADTEFIAQYMPRPIQNSTPGKQYLGNVGPGMRGWVIQNAVPANSYLGGGGTHQLPDDAYQAMGVWGTDFEVDAGASSIIRAHCNLHGCNRWDSGYSLFDLDSAGGQDFMYYVPQTSTLYWTAAGRNYTYTPNSMTIPGSLTMPGTFTMGPISGTSSGFASTGQSVALSQSGDQYGATSLTLENRNGLNGALFRNSGLELVDFGFLDSAGYQNNLRSESGPSSSGYHNTLGEFDFITNATAQGGSAGVNALLVGGATTQFYPGGGGEASINVGAGTNPQATLAVNGSMSLGSYAGTVAAPANSLIVSGSVGVGSPAPAGLLSVGPANQFQVDASGNAKAASYTGPATAPSGTCPTNGVWVFSQDGHATFCSAGTWVTKI
ncbi:MAG TPA: hypothetical protein VFW30_05485 [Bryocella sp.]|nr:hypothetical protein [Bryocella sp.]